MLRRKKIDEVNILQATYIAMRQAIAELAVAPDLLLNDAVTIPEVSVKQVPIIKGMPRVFPSGRQVSLQK